MSSREDNSRLPRGRFVVVRWTPVGEFVVEVVGKTAVKGRARRKALDPPSCHSKPLPRWQRASETETPRVANPKPNESPPRGGEVTGPASRSLSVILALRNIKGSRARGLWRLVSK